MIVVFEANLETLSFKSTQLDEIKLILQKIKNKEIPIPLDENNFDQPMEKYVCMIFKKFFKSLKKKKKNQKINNEMEYQKYKFKSMFYIFFEN